jgi:hypothetical protein
VTAAAARPAEVGVVGFLAGRRRQGGCACLGG